MSNRTVCFNVSNKELTVWPEFAFSRIWRVGNDYYGVRRDGVFKLKGNTDNLQDFVSTVTLNDANLNSMELKRMPYIRIDADGMPIEVSASFDGLPGSTVNVESFEVAKSVKLGKGLKGRFFSLSFKSLGEGFLMRAIELFPDVLQRGVK